MTKKRNNIADACRDEAQAAFAQARTAKKRAKTLRTVAATRRAGALLDEDRSPGLRREAKRRSKASSSGSGRRATSTSGTTSGRR
jgi:hypothetical protein